MKELQFFKKFIHTMLKGDDLNWHERNSGNMSYRLTDKEVYDAKKYFKKSKSQELKFKVPELANEVLMITGSGKYFMNAEIDLKEVVGLIKIDEEGKTYKIVYGFEKQSLPTSELPTHLLIQQSLKLSNTKERTVYHAHPTYLNILTYVCEHDSYKFSANLWKGATEASVFIPKGVGVLKWMMPGSVEIGLKSCEMLKEFNMICWVHHGVFATGLNPDDTLGMIHVAEKAAEIHYKTNTSNLSIVSTIMKEDIIYLLNTFGIVGNPKVISKL